jgi:hypothetical protein
MPRLSALTLFNVSPADLASIHAALVAGSKRHPQALVGHEMPPPTRSTPSRR